MPNSCANCSAMFLAPSREHCFNPTTVQHEVSRVSKYANNLNCSLAPIHDHNTQGEV